MLYYLNIAIAGNSVLLCVKIDWVIFLRNQTQVSNWNDFLKSIFAQNHPKIYCLVPTGFIWQKALQFTMVLVTELEQRRFRKHC